MRIIMYRCSASESLFQPSDDKSRISMKRKRIILAIFLLTTTSLIGLFSTMFVICDLDREILSNRIEDLLNEQNRTRDLIAKLNDGWHLSSSGFIHKCYQQSKNYEEAEKSCSEQNARLVSTGILNETIWKEIWKYVLHGSSQSAWIGLRQPAKNSSDDVWIWSDGTPYDKSTTPWRDSEPNGQEKENCAQIGDASESGAELDDNVCESEYTYICEKEY